MAAHWLNMASDLVNLADGDKDTGWDQGPKPPPGMDGTFQDWIGWAKWIAIACGIIGLIACGVMMMVGRRNRSHMSAEGAAGPSVGHGGPVHGVAGCGRRDRRPRRIGRQSCLWMDLRQRSQKRMRLLVAGLVGVVVLLVGVLVGVLSSGGSDSGTEKKDDAGPPKGSASAQPSEAPDDAEGDGTFHDPDTWVNLPKGRAKKNGLPVKFPHTEKGGVAAAVENNRTGWNLEEKEIRKGLATYSDPENRETGVEGRPTGRQDGAQDGRRAHGRAVARRCHHERMADRRAVEITR
ncbi:hypothetical protein IHE61_31195 [Streptomyces sp. GKU 257-1]|nr:hypothetical protein [Streptomyces sp. GKU 257-1]